VNPVLAGVALAVAGGAVIAVSARTRPTALVGLAIMLGAAPFLSDPLPGVSTLAARVVGAALAAYLLRAADAASEIGRHFARSGTGPASETARGGSRLGWPAEALFAVAAALIGIAVASNFRLIGPAGDEGGLLAQATPAALAAAAGFAAIVVGIVPAFAGRGALRMTIGALVLLQGVLLVRAGLAGAPSDLEQLGGVALLVAVAAAGSVLTGLVDDRRPVEPVSSGGAPEVPSARGRIVSERLLARRRRPLAGRGTLDGAEAGRAGEAPSDRTAADLDGGPG
jgi:hypothetical protein